MGYKNFIFRINVFFPLKHGFRMFSVNKFHDNSFRCVGRISSKRKSMTAEPLQILTIFSSRSWCGIWFEIPDISTLLRRRYYSFFDSCFSRLTILFSKTLFTFFTIGSSLVSLSLVSTHKTLNIIRKILNFIK